MMTVKQFLEAHPTDAFNFMTPCGYLNLTTEKAKNLLDGNTAQCHLGCVGTQEEIPAEEILEQEFCDEPRFEHGVWYAMTQDPSPTMTMYQQ